MTTTVWNATIAISGQMIMGSVVPASVLFAWIVTGCVITVMNRYAIIAGRRVRPVMQLCVPGVLRRIAGTVVGRCADPVRKM